MNSRTSPEKPSESVWLAALLAAGSAATLLIWRQAEWESLLVKGFTLLACAAILAKRTTFPAPPTRAALLAIGSLIALSALGALQTLLKLSVAPHHTIQSTLDWLVASAVLLASWTLCRNDGTRRNLLTATTILGIVVCLFATLQFFTSNGKIFWLWQAAEPQVFGPFHSRNNYASFALLVFPLAAWKGFHREPNWYYITAAALIGASLVASGSRAGAILFAGELAILCILPRKAKRHMGAVLASGLLLLAAIAAAGWNQLELKLFDQDPFRHRREMLLSALDMLQAKPLTGFGLGTYPAVYPAFAHFDSGHYVNHAHNDWAELAAEGGIPALTCLALFAAGILPAIWRNPWGLGVPAVLAHSFVDYPMQRLGVLFWALMLAAALLATTRSDLKRNNQSARRDQPS